MKDERFYKRIGIERIMDKIVVDEQTGCWNWIGAKDRAGYGVLVSAINYDKRQLPAHRVMFYKVNGRLANWACHKCNNKSCVNPEHIYDGTPADNARDRTESGQVVGQRGEEHHEAKLTESDIRFIRSIPVSVRGSGFRLAERFGVSPSLISVIRSGKYWKHLDP